uniref:Uncharacterized protein n=1 Tax=Anopheles dirus TaxID=7168 RepID=A0A182NQY8_9DIPT
MAGLEIVVGTYEEFIVCYRAEPLRTDPTKMFLKESFATHLHTSSVRSVASNGKYVASGGADDRICLLDMREGTKVTEFLHHDGTINTLVFSNNGSHLFAGSNDGSMTAINMAKLAVDKTWKNAHKGGVQSISIHPQGKMALSLGGDMTLKTWDLITGRALFTTALNKNSKYGRVLTDVQWSQDGEHFALIGNRVVDIISIETTRSVRTLEFDTKPITMCWLSNEEIAVGLESGALVMANIHEEDQQEQLQIYDTRLKAISCLGNYIATASSAGDVSLWHLNDMDFIQICTQQVGCRPICLALMDTGKPLTQEDRDDVSGTALAIETSTPEAKQPASRIAMKVTKELAWVLESRGTRSKAATAANGSTLNSSNSAAMPAAALSLDPLNIAFDGSDPLSQFAKQQVTSLGKDPLSRMAAEMESNLSVGNSAASSVWKATSKPKEPANLLELDLIEPWAARRGAILNKYTTSEKLSIVTSFLTGGETIKPQTTMSEKVKYRLEQLDDFEEGSVRQMLDLSQQEYVVKIEQLNHELVQAWNQDQRVKALKIAIQCSKLLSDTSVIQFYPSKFVLITDILDIFGRLVYDRLRTKADYVHPGTREMTSLPENFTPDMVPESAKETCQNWFYKIASIRELLPRLYVEIAILRCYSFLAQDEFSLALRRLTKMIRGIGDPLVAIYARCYLCRVGMGLTLDRTYVRENLDDVLMIYHTIFNGGIRSEIARHRITLNGYISLYLPALDWILQGVAILTTDNQLDDILQRCKEKKNPALLLQSMMQSFRSDFIASRANHFVQILSSVSVEGLSRGQLFRLLGSILSHTPPPTEQRLSVLASAMRTISSMGNVEEFMQCAEMWAQYTSQHFGLKEVDSFLSTVLQQTTPNRVYEQHYHELQVIVDKIVSNAQDIHGILALDNFLPILDLFQKESIKLEVCKNILTSYRNATACDNAIINDPVVTNALMYISRVLNDSVNALTGEDERRQISGLVCHFIRKVDFGRDFEQQLAFYVEARSVLPNLDSALSTLIHSVNRLATSTRRIVKGQHTQKTAAFVKACAAYCFITIPSIIDVRMRMELYLQSGQVALLNVCLQHADSCFEAALNLIPEVPRTVETDGKMQPTEGFVKTFVVNFLSTLVIVPDNPTQGVLYLLRLLLEVVPKYPFEPTSSMLSGIYLHVLDFLSVAAQEVYPYHIVNVISNDDLYGSDPKFIAEVNELCCTVCDKLLQHLKLLLESNALRAQSQLALDLFLKIITGADLSVDKMFTLTVNLWNLAVKNRSVIEPKQLHTILTYTEHLAQVTQMESQRQCLWVLLEKMKSRL